MHIYTWLQVFIVNYRKLTSSFISFLYVRLLHGQACLALWGRYMRQSCCPFSPLDPAQQDHQHNQGFFAQRQWIRGNLFSLRHDLPVVATMALLESRQGGEMDKPRARSTATHCPSKGTPPSPFFWSRQLPGVRGGRRRRRNGLCCHLAPNTSPRPGLDPGVHQQFQEHPSLAATSAPVFRLPRTPGLLNGTGPQAERQ